MTRHERLRAAAIGLLVTGLLACYPGAAAAGDGIGGDWTQERGFSLGLQYQTSLIGAEDPPAGGGLDGLYFDEVGHGLTLNLGYAISPTFGLRLALGSAAHGTTQEAIEAYHSTIVLEAHYRFLPAERARPYLIGGIGGGRVFVDTDDFDSEIEGGVAVLGLGFLYSLSGHFLLDFSARLDLINWNTARVTQDLPGGGVVRLEAPVDDSGSAGKFQFGLLWQL